jgi:Ankyrin repeats (3 copies)
MCNRAIAMRVVCLLLLAHVGCVSKMSLYEAIRNDDADAIEKISKVSKSTLSNFSLTGDSPLMYAMEQDSKNAFLTLLKCGADPNRVGANGRNLMTFSAAKQDIFWLKKALLYGGDPNLDNQASPQRRCTPLIAAARDDRIDNLKLLIEDYKADINYITDVEDALFRATSSVNFRAVLYLLQSGCDFRRKTGRYTSFADKIRLTKPEDFLQEQKQKDFQAVIDWLHDQGIEWNKPRQDGDTWVY